MSTLTDIEEKLMALDMERTMLIAKIHPLQEQVSALWEQQKVLREQRDKIRLDTAPLDWKEAVTNVHEISTLMYRRVGTELHERFAMSRSGYWNDTQETNFEVRVDRGNPESLRKNTEGVKFLTPLFTPHKEDLDDGEAPRVWFGISEHTLAEHGVFRLEVLPDLSRAFVTCTRRSHHSVLEEFPSVEAAMAYINERHWSR